MKNIDIQAKKHNSACEGLTVKVLKFCITADLILFSQAAVQFVGTNLYHDLLSQFVGTNLHRDLLVFIIQNNFSHW